MFSEIINGNTDTFGSPRNLSLNPILAGNDVNDPTQTTSIIKHTLTNLSGVDRLMTYTATSKVVFQNTSLILDGTFTFTHGSIEIVGDVGISGSGQTFRFESSSLLISSNSSLSIGNGVTLEFAPTSSRQRAIYFEDNTGKERCFVMRYEC